MIVVTTPTGAIGKQVLANVLEHDEAVRVIVRDGSRLPASVRDRVEVVEGSHGDPEIVRSAFAGAGAVFWLCPPNPNAASAREAYVSFTSAAAEAFRSEGVHRVVGVSALGRGTRWAANAGFVTGSLAMDDLIANSGVSYRALTNPSFMDNIARQAGPINAQGMFFSPISGDRKLPAVATSDIAAVATRLLVDESWSGVEEVPVLGPQDMSFNDMAAVMSDVLGKPVTFQQIAGETYKNNMMRAGMSDAMAQGMLDMAIAKDNGIDNAVIRTASSTSPTTFRQWCERSLRTAINR